MKRYRYAVATCAAGLSLTACSAGVTQATPSTSTTTQTTAVAKPTSSPSPSPTAPAGSTVSLGGSIGNFPLPPGAKVAENVATGGKIIFFFGSVTPARVASFYASALPRAGYKVTSNTSIAGDAAIMFTGHGYKGALDAIAKVPDSSGASSGGVPNKNLTGVTFTQQ
jgi:hypothetical protein